MANCAIAQSVEDGRITTGKDFLMAYARACGTIPRTGERFDPKNGIEKHGLDKDDDEIKKWRDMNIYETRRYIIRQHINKVKNAINNIAKYKAINERFETIREQVAKWAPPNEECENIKKYALKIIDHSIYDDEWFESYIRTVNEFVDLSDEGVRAYWLSKMSELVDDYNWSKERYDTAVKRTERKNKVMKEFIDSLDTIKE